MVKLTKHLIAIQGIVIILSHVILKSDAGIAGLIASAALMAMFRFVDYFNLISFLCENINFFLHSECSCFQLISSDPR